MPNTVFSWMSPRKRNAHTLAPRGAGRPRFDWTSLLVNPQPYASTRSKALHPGSANRRILFSLD